MAELLLRLEWDRPRDCTDGHVRVRNEGVMTLAAIRAIAAEHPDWKGIVRDQDGKQLYNDSWAPEWHIRSGKPSPALQRGAPLGVLHAVYLEMGRSESGAVLWSKDGREYPWLTRREAQRDARSLGLRAVFRPKVTGKPSLP